MKKQTSNTAAIFKNKNKAKSSTQPDYKGYLNVGGKDYEIACWINEAKESKEKYFSCKIQEPYNKQEQKPQPKQEEEEEIIDDLPF